MSDRSPTPPPRMSFSLASGALFIGILVVAVIFINKANLPVASGSGASPPASPSTSASSSASTTVAYADCSTATFGAALAPLNPPADPHVYPAPPPMQIDVSKLYKVTITTARGPIVLCLQPSLAPGTVNNFVALARNHYYDGLKFHRVVAQFIIQGGDPLGNGNGGPGYRFNDEPVRQQYVLGALAMANSTVNTNGSQFFICIADDTARLQPHYNLFGKVASGLDVAQAVQQGDVMQTVTVSQQQ